MSLEFQYEVNGYSYGDRLLEDVIFDVNVTVHDLDTIEITSIKVQDNCKYYFDTLNADYWYGVIKKSLENHPWDTWENITEQEWDLVVETFGEPVPLQGTVVNISKDIIRF